VFLDRDGILNELVIRDGQAVSPRRLDDFRLLDVAGQAVKRLGRMGLHVLVATNQPDIARGLMNPRDLEEMTRRLQAALAVDDVMVCPHDDADGCECRKPKPGMLLALAERWHVDLSQSFLVGDSWKDVEAGRRAGCRTVLVGPRAGAAPGVDAVVPDLTAAVAVIESYL
jgi:D-glycero-D-manno-heptose 1,7-bisphosphate phosphatase